MDAIADIGFDVRPEHALMLRCIRAYFGAKEALPPVRLDEIDADLLLAEAGEHGLIPLMHRQLEQMPGIPTAWREAFKADAQRIVASSLGLSQELVSIAQHFVGAGVDALAFKGPAQAVQAYGDLGFRPFSDLDLLVRWRDVEDALRVLEDQGYILPEPMPSLAHMRAHWYHVPCHHPAKEVLVEVHWHPVSNRFVLRLDEGGYWERRASVEIRGHSVPTTGWEDTLLITCAHATKHHWERLEWAVSVAALSAASAELNWSRALDLAEYGGIRRVLLTGLALAQTISGLPLPDEIEAAILTDRRARPLAHRVLRTTLRRSRADNPTASEPLYAVGFHLLVRNRFSDGLRYLLTPKDSDRDVLPAGDAPLAVVIGARAYRLVKRHLTTTLEDVATRARTWMQRRVRREESR